MGRSPGVSSVAVTTEQSLLGEGLRWDARRGELLGVDLLAGRVHRWEVADDGGLSLVREYRVSGTVGAIAPIHGDDGWLLAAGLGFNHLSPDGSVRALAEVTPAGTRMNDAACDPQGRFWAGTVADDSRTGGGALYRLDGSGQTELVLGDLTISNGLSWSPDGGTMYLADSGTRVVHTFSFDGERGTISDGRVLVTVAEEVGAPDGLTVDAEGDLWVAIYGGGRVHRYSPEGELREALLVPAVESTSCAFAGAALSRLYVTTATQGWSDEQRRAEPAAGLVYRLDTDATGRPAEPFRPDPAWWASVIAGPPEPGPSGPLSVDGRWLGSLSQRLAQTSQSAERPALHRPGRDAERGRDLRLGQPAPVGEVEDLALGPRQRRQRCLNLASRLTKRDVVVGALGDDGLRCQSPPAGREAR